jgi:aryl-alcohol dehydrogenase-like predicted oxidoreductase
MLGGFATPEGTRRFVERFAQLRDAGHFRKPEKVPGAEQVALSSIGLGTYLGEPSDEADRNYNDAIVTALRSGINVVDTAINYRHQRSERNIGVALQRLVNAGELKRDEVFVSTKAGYLSFDANMPADPRVYFRKEYVESGILDPMQIAGGMHCMAPKFLANQIERSRRNLGLETIDLFYLHNPESQLADVSHETFRHRLKDAFALLEKEVKEGKLRFYGMATWNAFRVPEGSRDYLNLFEAALVAREAGGEHHHFRFIQLPFNLAMPEAHGLANQTCGKHRLSAIAAAGQLDMAAIGSATLYQGQLTQGLPSAIGKVLGMKNDADNAIQFARSAPGITTSLIGMGHQEHVVANLKPALAPPTKPEQWMQLFAERRVGS